MNIFFLDPDPAICAEYHCDKHVVKMCVEYAQILSTAHRVIDGIDLVLPDERETIVYKTTHTNHPSTIWARSSRKNYAWLSLLWRFLLKEYTFRYNKIHKTSDLLFALSKVPNKLITDQWSDPPPAMPDDCKVNNNSILSYQQYYVMEKSKFATWKNRRIPSWYTQGVMGMVIQKKLVNGMVD